MLIFKTSSDRESAMSLDSLFQSSLCSLTGSCHLGLSYSTYNLCLLKTEHLFLFITFYIFKECYHPLQPPLLQSKHSKFLWHIFFHRSYILDLWSFFFVLFPNSLYIPWIKTLKTQHCAPAVVLSYWAGIPYRWNFCLYISEQYLPLSPATWHHCFMQALWCIITLWGFPEELLPNLLIRLFAHSILYPWVCLLTYLPFFGLWFQFGDCTTAF